MASKALENFETRLQKVRQLIDAHGALVRLRKAEQTLANVGNQLAKVGEVINALVSEPGVGKPPEVQALNSAAIALLSGHLQGFISDIFDEVATTLLGAHVADIATLIGSAPTRGNPNEQNINKLFGSIGFPSILDGISWKKMSNRRFP